MTKTRSRALCAGGHRVLWHLLPAAALLQYNNLEASEIMSNPKQNGAAADCRLDTELITLLILDKLSRSENILSKFTIVDTYNAGRPG